MASIGQRIAWWRKERKLTQAELEQRVGLTVASVSKIEKGHRTVTTEELGRIAHALRVDTMRLLGDEPCIDPLYTAIAGVRAKCTPSQRQAISDFLLAAAREFATTSSE